MNEMFLQMIYYIMMSIVTLVLIGFLQMGFFWKYLKVKMSMGKLVLVKIREVNRDDYAVGQIEEGDLIYKLKKDNPKRINIPTNQVFFYKTLGITMIDVDSQKNAICSVDYEAVVGFDAVKQSDLLKRALYKPQIDNQKEKIIMIILVILIIAVVFSIFLSVQNSETLNAISIQISNMKGSVSGVAKI